MNGPTGSYHLSDSKDGLLLIFANRSWSMEEDNLCFKSQSEHLEFLDFEMKWKDCGQTVPTLRYCLQNSQSFVAS